MDTYITIRPHHLLCIPGYKGQAYSKEHENTWDKLSKAVNEYPNINMKIVSGKISERDYLCKGCPYNSQNKAYCNNKVLNFLDEKVKKIANIKDNKIYSYSYLLERLKNVLDPQKHKELCGDCGWRLVGLCEDTFKKIH